MAVAAVGGNSNVSAVGVTTLSVTRSVTAGNTAVVFLFTAGAISALTVQDNLGNNLTAGPISGNLRCYYQFNAPSGVTGYTATWTGSQQCSLEVEEYSGVGAVNSSFAANVASGSSASASITIAILAANNFIVCGFGSANTLTASVGTQRQQTTTSTARETLVDNTSATVGNVTCTCTLTSAAWNACGIELGGTGKVRTNQDLELVVKRPTSAKVRANQDLQLVIEQKTSANVRVNQDITLVIQSVRRARAKQDLQLVVKQPTSAKVRVNQDLQLVIIQNSAPTAAVQPFVFVTC